MAYTQKKAQKIMEQIIAFIFRKGGGGKSTGASTFAFSKTLSKYIQKIALVELDPQNTLKKWHKEREKYKRSKGNVTFTQILDKDPEDIKPKLANLLEEQELLILDTPGESTEDFSTKFALEISDIVIIPMRASTKDEDGFEEQLLPLIEEIIIDDPDRAKSFYILPTFFYPQTKIENIQAHFKDLMPEYIQCLPVFLPFRSLFENFDREGKTIDEYAKSVKSNAKKYQQAKKAAKDIENIAKAVVQVLKNHN